MASENIDKLKALDLAMRQIEKDFGKGSIMKLGEASSKMNIEVIPTGALSLDIALGVGGIPRGRVIEIYGPESSGKTTVALHMIAETNWAAMRPLSTPSMRWTRNMHAALALMLTTC